MATKQDYIDYINRFASLHAWTMSGGWRRLLEKYLGDKGRNAPLADIKKLAKHIHVLDIFMSRVCGRLPELDIANLSTDKLRKFTQDLEHLLERYGLIPPEAVREHRRMLGLPFDKYVMEYDYPLVIDIFDEQLQKLSGDKTSKKKKSTGGKKKVTIVEAAPSPPKLSTPSPPKPATPPFPKKKQPSEFQILLRQCIEKYGEEPCKKARTRLTLINVMEEERQKREAEPKAKKAAQKKKTLAKKTKTLAPKAKEDTPEQKKVPTLKAKKAAAKPRVTSPSPKHLTAETARVGQNVYVKDLKREENYEGVIIAIGKGVNKGAFVQLTYGTKIKSGWKNIFPLDKNPK
jgi:hypothetical protein